MAGTILTTIGLSKLAAATPQNQLNITHISVGDGNGGFPTLSPTMTALTNEVWRSTASNPIKDGSNSTYVYFETNIPPEVGPFDVREIACFDIDGDMISIGHTSLIQKPNPVDDASFAVAVKIFIALENAGDFDLIYQNVEVTSHNSLSDRNVAGAHDAASIENENGGSAQNRFDLDDLDTVADMLAYDYTGLPEDTPVKWGGYYVKGDGGGNSGLLKFGANTEDGGSVFSIDANTYIKANFDDVERVNLKLYGLEDNSNRLIEIIEKAAGNNEITGIYIQNGNYIQDKKLEINRSNFKITTGNNCTVFYSNSISADGAASISGSVESEHLLSATTSRRFKTFTITGASTLFEVGEDIIISSGALAYPNGRVYDLCYQISRIKSISADTILIEDYAEFDYSTMDNAKISKINWLDNVVIDGIYFVNSDDSTRFGLSLYYCKEPVVKNTKMDYFNDSGVELWYCKGGDINNNAGSIVKDEALNYSLTLYGCDGVSVFDNEYNSARTAIDVSRLSRNCSVHDNNVVGNISTHTAHYNTIRDNDIVEGGTLIRGPHNEIFNNTYKNSAKVTTLGFSEAGQDGPANVFGNVWYGQMTARSVLYPSGVSFNNNKFYLTDIQTTSEGTRCLYALFGLDSYEDSSLTFSGNEISLSNDIVESQVLNAIGNLAIVKEINVTKNTSKNFKGGYDLSARSDNSQSSGLVFCENKVYGVDSAGISWRLTDDVDISRNKFYGAGGTGSVALYRTSGGSSERQSLRLQDNDIVDFDVGINAEGSLDYTDCIDTGNKMINTTTKRVNTENFIPYID